MPRIPHSTLLRAYKISPLLPLVLRGTRDFPLAIRELRWMVEHVQDEFKKNPAKFKSGGGKGRLKTLCKRREKSEPLQYILGSQPFGPLDIKCRRGVLIPRPETESITTHLAEKVKRNELHEAITYKRQAAAVPGAPKQVLRILDLCSGSGCISLLLSALLAPISAPQLGIEITGIDISPTAISLAKENLRRNLNLGHLNSSVQVSFHRADIFDSEELGKYASGHYDIIVSNPPYVCTNDYRRDVTRSVQKWEPRKALVPVLSDILRERFLGHIPVREGDSFYHQILEYQQGHKINISSDMLLLEVGDLHQANKVLIMNLRRGKDISFSEFWHDQLDFAEISEKHIISSSKYIPCVGQGKLRAVAIYRLTKDKDFPGLTQGLPYHMPNRDLELADFIRLTEISKENI